MSLTGNKLSWRYPFIGIRVSRELARNVATDVIRNGTHGIRRATSYNVRELRNATDDYKRRCMDVISDVMGRDACPESMASPAYLAASLGRLSLLSAIAMDYDGDGEKDEDGNCSGNAIAVYTLAKELADGAVNAFFGMPELLYGTVKGDAPDATNHIIEADGGLYDGSVIGQPGVRRRNLTREELGFPYISDIISDTDEKTVTAVEGELATAWQCILEAVIVKHICREVADGHTVGAGDTEGPDYSQASLAMLRGCSHLASTFDIMGTGTGAFADIKSAIGLVDRMTGIIDSTVSDVRRIGGQAGIIRQNPRHGIDGSEGTGSSKKFAAVLSKEASMKYGTQDSCRDDERTKPDTDGSVRQPYLMFTPTRPRPYIEGIGRPIVRFDANGKALVWDEFRHEDMPVSSVRDAYLMCPWLSPTYIVGCVTAYLYDVLRCGKGDENARYAIHMTNIQHCSTVEVLVYGKPVAPSLPYPPQKAKMTLRVDFDTSAVSLHVSRQDIGIDVMPEVVIDWLEDGKTLRVARYVAALAEMLLGENEKAARDNEFATMNGNLWTSCPSDDVVRDIVGESC